MNKTVIEQLTKEIEELRKQKAPEPEKKSSWFGGSKESGKEKELSAKITQLEQEKLTKEKDLNTKITQLEQEKQMAKLTSDQLNQAMASMADQLQKSKKSE